MILVTGGTGLVGSHLLHALLLEGHRVRAIHRKGSDLENVKKIFAYYSENAESRFNSIEWMEADIIDIPQLESAFEGITHVYHAAAYVNFDPKNYYKLKKTNIEGTANIVNMCLAFNIQKLCYVSSIATLGNPVNGASINEETHWNPENKNSVYAITKFGAEMEVWRGSQEGLKIVIVNPGVILGEGLWHKGSGSIVKRVSKGLTYYTTGSIGLVDVLDVVAAMIALMKSSVFGERYILVAENKTYHSLLSDLSKVLGEKPPTQKVEKWKLVVFSKFDALFSWMFGTKRKLLRTFVDSLYTSEHYDGSKIIHAIPFTYRPIEESITRIAERYRKDIIQ